MPKNFRRIKKYCLYCETLLILNNSRGIKRKNFCSRSCSTKYYQENGVIIPWINHTSEEQSKKMKMAAKKRRSYMGENNPNYIDGHSLFKRKYENKYGKIKKCLICNSKKYLRLHHIEFAIRDNTKAGRPIIKADNSANNGLSVCAKCHKKIHLGLITFGIITEAMELRRVA